MTWENYKIGDFLIRRKEPVKIKQQEEYTLVTIRMYHKGVAKRSVVLGSSIKSQTLYKVRAGQFILSGIDARNRAFGIVPDELDGAVVTNDFWTHDIDTSIIDINFFYWFSTTPQFNEACIKASEGTTNRQRLQASKFYSFDIKLPSIDKQKEWVERISHIQKIHEHLNQELDKQQNYILFLRQTILQEAIQGKLIKQDPTDEPATNLLKRIKTEKEKLIKAGTVKKEKELSPITEGEIPFKLPEEWVWCRLGEVCVKIGSGSTPRGGKNVYKKEGIKFIRSQNIYNDGLVFGNVVYIDFATHKKMEGTKVIPNDILLNITGGSIGRCALVPKDFDEANVSQHVTIIRTVSLVEREFIHQLMISPYFQDNIMTTQTGGNREGLAKKNMELMLIPIPPLIEQQRIVVKVQQLKQQLNQLETQVNQSLQYLQKLLQSVLKEAFEQKESMHKILSENLNMVAEP